jgi:uncharacterized cupin superfamily protein
VLRANVFDVDCEYDETDSAGYRAAVAAVGKAAGGKALAIKVFEVPKGQSVCPYHYEYEEEWLLVLDGDVVVRTPDGDQELREGDLVRFAPGPAGAHKVSNRAESVARLMMFSSAHEPAVAVYPDSDKISVWTPGGEDNVTLRRADGKVDYWDGER